MPIAPQGWEFIKEKKGKKKTRKHARVLETKNALKKTCTRPRKRPRKRSRKKDFFFLGRFLGRERVFLRKLFFS